MSALYQRARPVRFHEVIGQEHVVEVLWLAVRQGRIGHAYLFSGPRGVGKTTSARLLAMAANCEHEDPAERPCGRCASCRLVQEGSHPDVTELDAASNNSVEDVRELREKVGLAGLRGGTRVWILDEAHMLSRAAANALLKTLEEPPPGLVFILATTEPEKLPPTVLSRCQHFRFRRLSDAEIVGKLTDLVSAAGVEAEPEALALVARVAEGGMRDAESMLERLLLPGDAITARAAEEALGLPPRERLEGMSRALGAGDVGGLLDEAGALYRDGFAPRTLAEQLGRTLRDALLGSVKGEGFGADLDVVRLMTAIRVLDDEMERFVRHNDLYALEVALLKTLQAAGTAPDPEAEPPSAPATKGAAPSGEAAAPSSAGAGPVPPAAVVSQGNPPATRGGDTADGGAARPPIPDADAEEAAAPAPDTPTAAGPGSGTAPGPNRSADLSWHAVKSRAGAQLKAFLMPAQESIEGDVVRLRYDAVHRFHHGQVLGRADELASLVADVAGPGYTILIEGPEGGPPKKIA